MAVLQGNMENNHANIARIEEELKGQEDRSGGIVAQIDQTRVRIAEIEETLKQKRQSLEQLQQQLTVMTANAQGITKQYLELRGKESSLAADSFPRSSRYCLVMPWALPSSIWNCGERNPAWQRILQAVRQMSGVWKNP